MGVSIEEQIEHRTEDVLYNYHEGLSYYVVITRPRVTPVDWLGQLSRGRMIRRHE